MEASRRKRNGLMGGGFFGTSFKKTWTNISPISLEEYLVSALITITLSLEANSVLSPGIKSFNYIVLRSLAIGFLGSQLYELGPMVGFGLIYHFFVVYANLTYFFPGLIHTFFFHDVTLHLNQGMCVLLGCFSSSDTYILIGVWFW
jgi:hypothetical protein